MPTFICTLQFLNEKNKILQDVKSPPWWGVYLLNFHEGKIM